MSYRCNIPSCSGCIDRRWRGPSRQLAVRRPSESGMLWESRCPLLLRRAGLCINVRGASSEKDRGGPIDPRSRPLTRCQKRLSSSLLRGNERLVGLWRRGTMTVIRSVFVPGDGWLLRTPGRPSLHLALRVHRARRVSRRPRMQESGVLGSPRRLPSAHHIVRARRRSPGLWSSPSFFEQKGPKFQSAFSPHRVRSAFSRHKVQSSKARFLSPLVG